MDTRAIGVSFFNGLPHGNETAKGAAFGKRRDAEIAEIAEIFYHGIPLRPLRLCVSKKCADSCEQSSLPECGFIDRQRGVGQRTAAFGGEFDRFVPAVCEGKIFTRLVAHERAG